MTNPSSIPHPEEQQVTSNSSSRGEPRTVNSENHGPASNQLALKAATVRLRELLSDTEAGTYPMIFADALDVEMVLDELEHLLSINGQIARRWAAAEDARLALELAVDPSRSTPKEVAPAVASSDPGIELKELLREFDDAWGEYGCWLSDRISTPFRFDRIQAARSAIKHYVASLRAEVESQHEYRHALILARNYWRKEATGPWRTEIKVSIPLPAGMQDLSEMEMDYIKAKANQALDQLIPEEAAKATSEPIPASDSHALPKVWLQEIRTPHGRTPEAQSKNAECAISLVEELVRSLRQDNAQLQYALEQSEKAFRQSRVPASDQLREALDVMTPAEHDVCCEFLCDSTGEATESEDCDCFLYQIKKARAAIEALFSAQLGEIERLRARRKHLHPEMFPIQGAPPIPWSVAEKAYAKYGDRHGQSLERLAERGGFGVQEMDEYYPSWRSESDELLKLRAELASLRVENETYQQRLFEEIRARDDDSAELASLRSSSLTAGEADMLLGLTFGMAGTDSEKAVRAKLKTISALRSSTPDKGNTT